MRKDRCIRSSDAAAVCEHCSGRNRKAGGDFGGRTVFILGAQDLRTKPLQTLSNFICEADLILRTPSPAIVRTPASSRSAMAALVSTDACKTKKRKRKKERERKLLCGEKVEVRQFEDGLKGSWSTGVVIRCERLVRHVEYTDLLSENGSSKLIELISVSPVVEGMVTVCRTPKTFRGHIRPLPPHSNIQQSRLSYGLCVDAFVNDAWWEGVVFDHEEGAGERLVFFPDEGDQLRINVDHLRLSQDWDEVLGGWRHRGDWLFLGFIKKIEQEGSLPVSVRQIWYDMRANVCLRSRSLEWTCRETCVWEKLVLEAVQENVHAAAGQPFPASDFVAKKKLAACKTRRKTGESLILVSGADLGVQMDEYSPPMLVGSNVAEEDLAVRKSKRRKISKSRNSISEADSEFQIEECPQILDECIDQDKQICQPVLALPSELNAVALEPALDIGSEDSIDLHKEDDQENLSGPRGSDLVADDFISEEDLTTRVSERRKTCMVQSSASRSVLRDQIEDYGVQHTLDRSEECVGQENHLRQHGLAFPSVPNTAALEPSQNIRLEGLIDVHNPSANACGSHFHRDFSTRSQGISPLPSDLDPQTPKPKAPSDSISPYGDNHCVQPHLVPGDSARLEAKMQPLATSWVLGNGPTDINCQHNVSPRGSRYYSFSEACTAWKDDGIVHDMLNGNEGKNIGMRVDQDAELNSDLAPLEKEAYEASGGNGSWQSVGKELLSRAEYFPNAIAEYCALTSLKEKEKKKKEKRRFAGSKNLRSTSLKARLHLLFLGWKLEFKPDKKCVRKRYISPGGKAYPSLHTACIYLKEQEVKVWHRGNDHGSVEDHPGCKVDGPPVATFHPEPDFLPQDPLGYSRVVKKIMLREEHSSCSPELFRDNQDLRNDGLHKDTGRSSTGMATSDGRSDSDVRQIQLPEIQQQGAEGSPSHLGEKKKVHDGSEQKDTAVFRPEYCPQAVIDYYKCGKDGKYKRNTSCREIKQVRSKARMHLSAEGWKLWYVRKGKKLDLRYGLPNGGGFNSLWAACKAWTENLGIDKSSGISSRGDELVSKKFDSPISEKCKNCVNSVTPRLEIQRNAQLLHGRSCNGTSWSFGSLLSSELGSGEVRLTGVRKCRKRRNYSSFAVASQLLPHERNAHLLSWSPIVENVKPDGLSSLCDETVKHSRDSSSGSRKRKKQKSSGARITRGDKSDSRYLTHVLRSSKRAPRAVVPCSSQHMVRSVLSWLIDNDVVLPRQKVCYMQGKDRHVVAEGRITREGIKCKCCKKVYSLTGFEVHAGSSNHRPSAHIFLQDGRSLLQCQMQVVRDGKLKGLRSDPDARMKRDRSRWRSDNICSICRYGGKLVLCDHCPASFHLSCIDLKDVPEGKWSCPTCRCGICGKSDFNGDSEQFTAKTILYCDQCEREYHVGCLRRRGTAGLETCPEGNWFCSNKCSKIFMRIQKLIGKSKQTGVAGLTWTLLRPRKDVSCDLNTLDGEAMTEYHSKLSVALGVLHECFIPITEPRTKRDLVTDVIFNQGSELKRLNFRGFYTMLLERGDELISVATVRIFGAKVAEMPLIATRVQYRQQGMCRLLMNELEKMLSDLGVERLFLPATPQMLPKWVTSFGFTKMSVPERLKFLEYTFLEFQGTVMCQKVLMPSTIKAAESRSRGIIRSLSRKSWARDDYADSTCPTRSDLTRPELNGQKR
ncbi:uncharacterized protein LOC131223614 isoform X2 [Magnolia sinica]|uniref:uncharacterized protein LOC131223614 isoform X2 n=1 Tax=Magnolia sinica TaxID=86752 RepID=UPI002659A7AE|nr:uncharacterized protein LOC131223614 isoform X2 [Magnolia sinica]